MGGIGAVSPLRRFAPALRSGEPRAWWVSMGGGRAKGAVGIDGWSVKFRFMGLFAMNDLSNSAISCRGDAMSSPGAV